MSTTYTRAEVDRMRKFGDETKNGVVFDWWLRSAAGAGFCLIREPHHNDQDIEAARQQIRRDRDVVGSIGVATVKG